MLCSSAGSSIYTQIYRYRNMLIRICVYLYMYIYIYTHVRIPASGAVWELGVPHAWSRDSLCCYSNSEEVLREVGFKRGRSSVL